MARIELSHIGNIGTLALTTTGTSGAATLVGSTLNIPIYQGALTLSTAGTSGASTLVGDTLTIPTYQGQISLTTTGTSGASTFVGNTLNIPQYQGVISLTTTGTSGAATLVGNTLNVPQYSTAPAGSTGEIQYNNAGAFGASANLVWDNSATQLNIGAPSAPTGKLNVKGGGTTSGTSCQVWTNSGNTELMRVRDDGNVGIGTSSPGAKLQVNGSGGTPFAVQSSTNSNLFRVNENGTINFNLVIPNSGVLEFYGRENLDRSITLRANAATTLTSGEKSHVFILDGFSPTSGTANYRTLTLGPSINQTGGANGESIGLLVAPNLTSAANWKSLQWNNNSGWGIYGAGTAKSYFAGNVAIGTTTQNASAAFEVASTTQGILFPRMTTTQRDAITTPADGLVLYNTTDNKLQVRAGGAWVDLH